MTMKSDSALEAFAHCCTEEELTHFLEALPESGKERLKTHGHLALPLAMEFNNESSRVLEILLDRSLGIQVNLPHIGQEGNTILHFAVLLQDTKSVRLLLDRDDLDPNVRNQRGETPLHVAVEKGSFPNSLKILDSLLSDSRVNISATNSNKRTPLHVACMSKLSQVEVVSKLLDSAAITKDKISLLQFLQSSDELGRTALHYAAESGPDEIVDQILKALQVRQPLSDVSIGQLVLAGDAKGCLAVHLAAQNGHFMVVQELLPFCASKDQDGVTLLHHAIRSGCNDIVELCLNGSFVSLPEYLKLLSLTTHFDIAEFLLEKLYETLDVKDGIKNQDQVPTALLQWAVKNSAGNIGSLLIPHILKWHPQKANEFLDPAQKQTPLHIAAILENEGAVQALCSESAPWDLRGNKRDVYGYTALDHAFKKKNKPIQRILMKRQDVKDYLARLHKNRETYAKASNAILVVAVLIATLTYVKCSTNAELQSKLANGSAPSPSAGPSADLTPNPSPPRSGTDFLEYATMPTRVAFFLATTSCILAAFAALPFSFGLFFVQTTDDNYVRRSLYKTRVLIVVASYCLVLSLGAVLFGFICSQYISPFVKYKCAKACEMALLVFVCLSVVFVLTNAVTAVIWPKWKKKWSWKLKCLFCSCAGLRNNQPSKSLSAKHQAAVSRTEQTLDKKQSKKLKRPSVEV